MSTHGEITRDTTASRAADVEDTKIHWWEDQLLPRERMTKEELSRGHWPYADHQSDLGSDLTNNEQSGLAACYPLFHGQSSSANSSSHMERRPPLPQLHSLPQQPANVASDRLNHGQFEPLPTNTPSYNDLIDCNVTSTGSTASLQDSTTANNRMLRLPIRVKQFSLLESLCDKHEILLYFVSYLTIPGILNLYAISKRFHFLWNANYVAYIKASLRTWAPGADEIFPWACYKSLCIKDPYTRQKSKWTGKEGNIQRLHEDKRDVPSLRWLQMVIYREGVSLDILIQMALKGLRCMPKTSEAVKRIWFLLDLPLNSHRIALMRSQTYITNRTLLQMTGFMLKVDMFLTDPFGESCPVAHPNDRLHPPEWAGKTFTGVDLRECLLAERSLTPLWRILRGWSPAPSDPQIPMTRLDILRLWARHKFQFPEDMLEPVRKMSFMGVPWWQIGTARLERVGVNQMAQATIVPLLNGVAGATLASNPSNRVPETLHGPDELVMLESIRRRLRMHTQWLQLVAWGSHDGVGRQMPHYTEEDMNCAVLGRRLRSRQL